jgi:hypothetical protein
MGAFIEVFTFGCTQFDKAGDDLSDGHLLPKIRRWSEGRGCPR